METDDTPPPRPAMAASASGVPPDRPRPWWDVSLGWAGWLFLILVIVGLAAGLRERSRIVESTPKTEARVMATTIANAVEQYYTEYSRLPLPRGSTGPGGDTDRDTDTSAGPGLIADLLGKEQGGGNTRSQDFLDGFKQARMAPDNPAGWKNGLVYEEGHYSIIDPWGRPFHVRLDTGGDGYVACPPSSDLRSAEKGLFLRRRVAVWSAGKDGDWDTREDNVTSWE